jgi:hypothetical protein
MSKILADGTWMCCHNPLLVDGQSDSEPYTCMTCGAQCAWGDDGYLVVIHEDFSPGWEERLQSVGVVVPGPASGRSNTNNQQENT